MMGAKIIVIFGIISFFIFGLYLLFLVMKDKADLKKIDRILNRKEGDDEV